MILSSFDNLSTRVHIGRGRKRNYLLFTALARAKLNCVVFYLYYSNNYRKNSLENNFIPFSHAKDSFHRFKYNTVCDHFLYNCLKNHGFTKCGRV